MLKIGTYNIKNSGPLYSDPLDSWDNRKASIKEIILDQNWDIFGLQEVKEDQLMELKTLSNYNYVGEVRDLTIEGEYNPVFYREDLFVCLDYGTFWLSDTPEEMSHAHSWDAACPRIATWVKLENKNTKEQVFFISTHLDHESEKARRKGAQLILDFIKQNNEENIVLVGDFNGNQTENFYHILTKYLKNTIENSQKHIGPVVTSTGVDFCQNPDWSKMITIDHIFVSSNAKILKTEVVNKKVNQRYPSDHFPVSSEITWDF